MHSSFWQIREFRYHPHTQSAVRAQKGFLSFTKFSSLFFVEARPERWSFSPSSLHSRNNLCLAKTLDRPVRQDRHCSSWIGVRIGGMDALPSASTSMNRAKERKEEKPRTFKRRRVRKNWHMQRGWSWGQTENRMRPKFYRISRLTVYLNLQGTENLWNVFVNNDSLMTMLYHQW